jgi:hypothetical protein
MMSSSRTYLPFKIGSRQSVQANSPSYLRLWSPYFGFCKRLPRRSLRDKLLVRSGRGHVHFETDHSRCTEMLLRSAYSSKTFRQEVFLGKRPPPWIIETLSMMAHWTERSDKQRSYRAGRRGIEKEHSSHPLKG